MLVYRTVAAAAAESFYGRYTMNTFGTVLLIILAVLVVLLVALYIFGRKMQKRQAMQQEQMEAMKQNVNMLVIDKKKMKLKDAGLPQMVMDNANFLAKNSKLPIVKAKVGPRVMTLVCDAGIFDTIPVKKEIKATVSGIYITSVKGIRGNLETRPQKKPNIFKRMANKITKK